MDHQIVTHVFGGLSDHRTWLRICVQVGMAPDVIFPVGRKYVVASSAAGMVFIKRGPAGVCGWATDARMFSSRLHARAMKELGRRVTDVTQPPFLLKWRLSSFLPVGEKRRTPVS